jgi:hypothetical protein
MYMAVTQAQVHKVRYRDERAAKSHSRCVKHNIIVERRRQHAGPDRNQAGPQKSKRPIGAMSAKTSPDTEKAERRGESHVPKFCRGRPEYSDAGHRQQSQ